MLKLFKVFKPGAFEPPAPFSVASRKSRPSKNNLPGSFKVSKPVLNKKTPSRSERSARLSILFASESANLSTWPRSAKFSPHKTRLRYTKCLPSIPLLDHSFGRCLRKHLRASCSVVSKRLLSTPFLKRQRVWCFPGWVPEYCGAKKTACRSGIHCHYLEDHPS